jgi:lysophospholipid acyltransferase (LPLAT)-like uncharacterized protein
VSRAPEEAAGGGATRASPPPEAPAASEPPPARDPAAWTPGASTVDEDPEARADMPLSRRLRRAARRWVKYPLMRLALAVLPHVYIGYLRLVWATSRVIDRMQPLHEIIARHDGAVGVLWHEEVFTVAWGYRDFRPHTLASLGDAGEAIARLLTRCGFVVFRGGSARSRTRRREVLPDMIEHMRTTRRVIYGITVDGSMGPRYLLKRGSCVIARECRKPVVPTRTWFKRYVRLPTWDRMAIPLPWNVILRDIGEPIYPPESQDDAALEAFRLRVEKALLELALRSYEEMGRKVPPALRAALARHEPRSPPGGTLPSRSDRLDG